MHRACGKQAKGVTCNALRRAPNTAHLAGSVFAVSAAATPHYGLSRSFSHPGGRVRLTFYHLTPPLACARLVSCIQRATAHLSSRLGVMRSARGNLRQATGLTGYTAQVLPSKNMHSPPSALRTVIAPVTSAESTNTSCAISTEIPQNRAMASTSPICTSSIPLQRQHAPHRLQWSESITRSTPIWWDFPDSCSPRKAGRCDSHRDEWHLAGLFRHRSLPGRAHRFHGLHIPGTCRRCLC